MANPIRLPERPVWPESDLDVLLVGSKSDLVDDEQRKRLEQIVGRCPVHKTLENPVRMIDSVEFAG